jgi:hypothetical protein
VLFINSILAKQKQERFTNVYKPFFISNLKLTMATNVYGIYRYVEFIDPDTGLAMGATAHRRGRPSHRNVRLGDIVCMGAATHRKFMVKIVRVNLNSASGIVVHYYDENLIGDVVNRPYREIWKTEVGPVVVAGIQHQVEVQVQAILAPPLALPPPEDAADPQDAPEVIAVLPVIADVSAVAAVHVPHRRPNNRPLQRQALVVPTSPCPICKLVPRSNDCILRTYNTVLVQCSVCLTEQGEFEQNMGTPHAIVGCGHSFCALCSAGLGYNMFT